MDSDYKLKYNTYNSKDFGGLVLRNSKEEILEMGSKLSTLKHVTKIVIYDKKGKIIKKY